MVGELLKLASDTEAVVTEWETVAWKKLDVSLSMANPFHFY
jgi:hypothetical protein